MSSDDRDESIKEKIADIWEEQTCPGHLASLVRFLTYSPSLSGTSYGAPPPSS
jgi:hypothetical protein